MLFEIKVSAESFTTDGASERFLFLMGVHVECQIVYLVESLVAYVTFIRFLSAMGQTVVLVVALLVEPFPAELTHERLEVSVDPHVGV